MDNGSGVGVLDKAALVLAALEAVKDKTGATYYTNYKDGWPLSQWQGNQGVVAGPDAVSIRDADDAPWTQGKEMYALDGLLFELDRSGAIVQRKGKRRGRGCPHAEVNASWSNDVCANRQPARRG